MGYKDVDKMAVGTVRLETKLCHTLTRCWVFSAVSHCYVTRYWDALNKSTAVIEH